MNRPRIAVMGTFDTKAEEYQYIIDRIGQLGADVLTIDVSTRDTAVLRGEYGCREIAQYAGSTYELLTSGTRAESMAIIMEGATKLVRQLLQEGRIQGLVSIGGSGVISVYANVMPAMCRQIVADWLDGNHARALENHLRYLQLMNDLFLEVNPIPVKAAMNMMGLDVGPMRLPLCEMGEANVATLRRTLEEAGLL